MNIFHPCDPVKRPSVEPRVTPHTQVAYRVEPLTNQALAALEPVELSHFIETLTGAGDQVPTSKTVRNNLYQLVVPTSHM